jgi:hypothetical protein
MYGLSWLRIQNSESSLRTFKFNRMLGISRVAEQLLTSQE